jgi:hypothetical protein
MEGSSEVSQPQLILQLSSPIEEAVLTVASEHADAEGSVASFSGVETGQATLSLSLTAAGDDEKVVGSSASPLDLAPYTHHCLQKDPLHPEEKYVRKVTIDIVAGAESGGGGDEEAKTVACSVTLQLTYAPSAKDRVEELYELLNKTSQKKAAAVERLRQAAVTRSRRSAAAQVTQRPSAARPAVKPGFLQKSRAEKSPSHPVIQWYNDKLAGTVQKSIQFGWMAKNYVLFGVFCVWAHYQGQAIGLPAPV